MFETEVDRIFSTPLGAWKFDTYVSTCIHI
jgi:hypothetical protein